VLNRRIVDLRFTLFPFMKKDRSHDEAPVGREGGRRPTWARIDLEALASNFRIIKERLHRDVRVMAVVKADAYGHGAIKCAQRLEKEGADWFGVALPEEGIELRAGGITKPILCLAGFWKGQEHACINNGLATVVYRLDMVEALDRAAQEAGVNGEVHVKIDTGMGRLGIRPEAVKDFCESLRRFRNIRVAGLMTHFASADDPSRDTFTADQLKLFQEASGVLRERGFNITVRHMANSAATFGHPEAHGNMVRPGGALYGLRDTLPPGIDSSSLRPVMSLHSRITLLKAIPKGEHLGYGCTFAATRETLVATVPIGYEDGYFRALSNRGQVLMRGSSAPVVGRVSMDLTLVDVTDVAGVRLDDQVTLLGEDGDVSISAENIASEANTISYEITCGVSERVPRLYV
jgi:alanine racemase